MKCAAVRIVTKLLNFEQKKHGLGDVDDPDLLRKVITGKES